MRRVYFVLLIVAGTTIIYSCNNTGENKETNNKEVQNKILQDKDGSISLKIDKADCYQDRTNPSSNTAEWNVEVQKSGRFNVWLSSATRDTTNLKYHNSVMLSILDNRLEAKPAVDKIVLNSGDVQFPYYRADSFMGSLYIQDTGVYNIQVISEKILPKDYNKGKDSSSDDSRLISVFLKPISQ